MSTDNPVQTVVKCYLCPDHIKMTQEAQNAYDILSVLVGKALEVWEPSIRAQGIREWDTIGRCIYSIRACINTKNHGA